MLLIVIRGQHNTFSVLHKLPIAGNVLFLAVITFDCGTAPSTNDISADTDY